VIYSFQNGFKYKKARRKTGKNPPSLEELEGLKKPEGYSGRVTFCKKNINQNNPL
jgi:hypothetical protein